MAGEQPWSVKVLLFQPYNWMVILHSIQYLTGLLDHNQSDQNGSNKIFYILLDYFLLKNLDAVSHIVSIASETLSHPEI